MYTIEYNSTSMTWSEDLDSIIDDYSSALDAFRRVFDAHDLPENFSSVRREAQRRNRPTHLILIPFFQKKWKKQNPDKQAYFERIHHRMAIVAEKYDEDTYTDPVTRQALIESDLEDEITLRDGTYQQNMRERCLYIVRSLADVLQYGEKPIPQEMREFLRGIDSTSSGPEQKQ